jgi:hypothetical protein
MRMVEVIADQIIDVIAVRNGLMSATWAMFMPRFMAGTAMVRRAAVRVGGGDFDRMLVYVLAMRMVQMTVMKIIDVIAVTDGGVAAARAMLVRVAFVRRCHRVLL